MSSRPVLPQQVLPQQVLSQYSSTLLSRLALFLPFLLLLAPAANAGEPETANSGRFLIAYRHCSDQFPPHVVSASIDYDQARSACYVRLARTAMTNLPPSTPSLLYAALQAFPESAEAVFDEALALGIEPYYAVTAATRALPLQDSEFARRAIAFGADPSRVTEATAAGHQIRPY